MRSKLDLTSRIKVTATMMFCTSFYLQQVWIVARGAVTRWPLQRRFLTTCFRTRQYPAFPLVLEDCDSWSFGGRARFAFGQTRQAYRPVAQSQSRVMKFIVKAKPQTSTVWSSFTPLSCNIEKVPNQMQ